MKTLLLILVLSVVGSVGCSGNNDKEELKPAEPSPTIKPKRLFMADMSNGEAKVLISFGGNSATVHCNSLVTKDGYWYVYKWQISNSGKNKCFARWEIIDHSFAKLPYIFILETDKSYDITHRSKEPPIMAYRTATCFEQLDNKDGSWDENLKQFNIKFSAMDFWQGAQTGALTLVPKNMAVEKDYK